MTTAIREIFTRSYFANQFDAESLRGYLAELEALINDLTHNNSEFSSEFYTASLAQNPAFKGVSLEKFVKGTQRYLNELKSAAQSIRDELGEREQESKALDL